VRVSDVGGEALANLTTDERKHPASVFHRDTLNCAAKFLEKRESRTKFDSGTVRVPHRVLNQDGVPAAEFNACAGVPRTAARDV
jgi:acyl dehydratase